MQNHLYEKNPLGIFLAIAFLAGGCEDNLLNQARQLSSISQDLKASFSALANDYVTTCFRRASYGLFVTNPKQDPFVIRKILTEPCNKQTLEDTKQVFIFENKIISSYLDAFGTLARGENFSFDVEVGKINDTIKKQTGQDLKAYNRGVFNQLLSFILKASTQQIAAKEIKNQVKIINPSFQVAICDFKNTFRESYKAKLDAEKGSFDDYYKKTIIIMIQRSRNESQVNALNIQRLRQRMYGDTPSKDKLPTEFAALPEVYQFDKQWREEEISHRTRYQALNKYVEILDTIASGHAALDKAAGGQGLNQGTFDEKCNPHKLSKVEAFVTNDSKPPLPLSANAELKLPETYLIRLKIQIKEFKTLALKSESKIKVNPNGQH
jgi:hypothetical protein